MMTTAERNRAIKKLVQEAFPRIPVTVRGHRGTAYGWFTVRIGYKPRDWEQSRELKALVSSLILKKFNSDIGNFGTPGDMGCDYGWGRNFHVNFDE